MDWRSQWGWTVVGARVLGSKVNPKTMGGRSWDCGGWRERSLGKNSRNCGARASAGPWASRIETAEKEDRCPTGALRRARELNWLGREEQHLGCSGKTAPRGGPDGATWAHQSQNYRCWGRSKADVLKDIDPTSRSAGWGLREGKLCRRKARSLLEPQGEVDNEGDFASAGPRIPEGPVDGVQELR